MCVCVCVCVCVCMCVGLVWHRQEWHLKMPFAKQFATQRYLLSTNCIQVMMIGSREYTNI